MSQFFDARELHALRKFEEYRQDGSIKSKTFKTKLKLQHPDSFPGW